MSEEATNSKGSDRSNKTSTLNKSIIEIPADIGRLNRKNSTSMTDKTLLVKNTTGTVMNTTSVEDERQRSKSVLLVTKDDDDDVEHSAMYREALREEASSTTSIGDSTSTVSMGGPVLASSSLSLAGNHNNLTLNEIVVQTTVHPLVGGGAGSGASGLASSSIGTAAVATNTTTDCDAGGIADTERNCWICFASDEDSNMAPWVQPCKCRGSTKWVHQSCLYRWVDEKQKGNALRAVSCQQCQTEYILVFPQMGKVAGVLETVDNLIKRVSPFLAAGVFVGSLYWTAVTYGAVTFLQIVGHKKGLALMESGDPLILLIGLPSIPVALILGRMIRWEDAVIRLIRNRRSVARKFPLMSFIIPYPDENDEQVAQNPITPSLSDPVSATRIFCGALLLPTISTIVGRLFFDSIENTLHRTLLGGLTFITVKGILKIYLKQQQYIRRKNRRIVDYTEENIRMYTKQQNNTNQSTQTGNENSGNQATGRHRHHHHQFQRDGGVGHLPEDVQIEQQQQQQQQQQSTVDSTSRRCQNHGSVV